MAVDTNIFVEKMGNLMSSITVAKIIRNAGIFLQILLSAGA